MTSFDAHQHRARARSGPAAAFATHDAPAPARPPLPPALVPGNAAHALPPGAMKPARASTYYASPPLPPKPQARTMPSPPVPPKVPMPLSGERYSPASFYNTPVASASPPWVPPAAPVPVPVQDEAPSVPPPRARTPAPPLPRPPTHRNSAPPAEPPSPPSLPHAPMPTSTSAPMPMPASASPPLSPPPAFVEEPEEQGEADLNEVLLRRAMAESMREHSSTRTREEQELADAVSASMRAPAPVANPSLYSRPQPVPPTRTPGPRAHRTTSRPTTPSSSSSSPMPTPRLPPAAPVPPSSSPVPTPRSAPSAPVPISIAPALQSHADVAQSAPAGTAALSEYPFPSSRGMSIRDQLAADEALARRLAAEDEAEAEAEEAALALIRAAGARQNAPTPAAAAVAGPSRRAYSTPEFLAAVPGASGAGAMADEDAPAPAPAQTLPGLARTANQFVEPELLFGLSFGFQPPPMGAPPAMPAEPIPNIIALPYGKAPPMHVQAPSWKHLLRLAAKLSGTRVEPALDAMARSNDPFRLRVVVQFIKNHHLSNDWRTVVYLTVDHPPPPKLPTASRYTSGDPTVLPFSYTLSALPALLRDGPDGSLSKYFVVQARPGMPLPALPLSLPNLALYLAAALEDSRAAARDEPGARLARLVDACYPPDAARDEDDGVGAGARKGLRVLAGRLMKRNKPVAKSRNADVYELVTPFVSEEWG